MKPEMIVIDRAMGSARRVRKDFPDLPTFWGQVDVVDYATKRGLELSRLKLSYLIRSGKGPKPSATAGRTVIFVPADAIQWVEKLIQERAERARAKTRKPKNGGAVGKTVVGKSARAVAQAAE